MTTTPGKPRISGIPTPGKSSGIPTPGRLRSSSSVASTTNAVANPDLEFLSRTLADAIKANDPAQHRSGRLSDASSASFSLQSTTFASASGQRIVPGRPHSSASSASAINSTITNIAQARAKPPAPRPPSRQSDVFTRSVSRSGRPYEIDDEVRIESLGFEGIVRFLGEIEGKSGIWAGVELNGGFAGKGKNNGSVNGKQYFSCPSNCGVFVALSKLSLPAVRISIVSRPSSVASSRSGRATPSVSGRATPSFISTGRVTPSVSTGRITPSLSSSRVTPSLPSGRTTPARSIGYPRSTMATPKTRATTAPENKITPGSRASRYVGVTANQLNSRERTPVSIPRKSLGAESPTRKAFASSMSPVRSLGSPFVTPKTSLSGQAADGSPSPSKGRMSLKTPKPRIPSAVAMPPPSSPSMALSNLSVISLNDDLPEMKYPITRTVGISGSPRPGSRTSSRSTPVHELLDDMSRLRSRLEALEFENQQLREAQSRPSYDLIDNSTELAALRTERGSLQSRIGLLEAATKTYERSLDERDAKIQSLERSVKEMALDMSKLKSDGENRMRDLQAKLDDNETLNKNLKEALEVKEGQENMNDAVVVAKSAEISVLEGRIEKFYKDLEDERSELGAQIDELRKAGQETIALYEERLSASETRRYEMEDLISSLEEQLRSAARPPSPSSLAVYASSAAQIDNETLKDQVQHLQKKITSLEDMLEDARAAAERDEAVVRERIKRHKDREESLKKDVNEYKKEIERLVRSEEHARQRLMESEEAFRENAVTLENARAEIEVLRNEQDSAYQSTSLKPDSSVSRDEIMGLKYLVQELQKENQVITQQNKIVESENKLLITETEQLRQELKILEDNVESSLIRDEASISTGSRSYPNDIQQVVEELKAKHEIEAEQLRKRLADIEMKNARTTHDLHKEISELESLIESKIYREDDLEREVERLKEKLARTQKKTSRNGIESIGTPPPPAPTEDMCEICEQPGHDIFSCLLLKDEPAISVSKNVQEEALFCEDCEDRGHVAADCPHSLDVF